MNVIFAFKSPEAKPKLKKLNKNLELYICQLWVLNRGELNLDLQCPTAGE